MRYFYYTTLLLITIFLAATSFAADAQKVPDLSKVYLIPAEGPVVEDNWKFHKIGTLWTRVTNFGFMGDDAYEGRTPSCDWPGGSGNSYLYRGTIWLTANIDGTYYTTMGDDHEFAPLDSVSMITGEGAVSDQDTWTRFYDVTAPLATDHTPLGLEIIQKTYAWSASYADDFVIYEWTIKNIGIDTDEDGFADTPRDLTDFFLTFRFDADVSKLPNWGAEYRFTNEDDHVLSNATPWEKWLPLFPQMDNREHNLTPDQCDSTLMFMWDGDNPHYPADNGQDDDFGNPGPDGTLNSPGFIGIKFLKSEPYLPPSSFHQCNIYNDPGTDKEAYDRMISKIGEFVDLPISSGEPFPYDYRGILTFGPLEDFAAGDSLIFTAALGVGCDPDSGGIRSLEELLKIMDVAQFLVDNNYEVSTEALAPPTPDVTLEPVFENGITTGIKVIWDDAATYHDKFAGYKVWKSVGTTAAGNFAWEPLGLGTYADTTGSSSWPPPEGDETGSFQIIDTDFTNGLDYYYSVQAFTETITYPIPLGSVETNVLNSLEYISPANAVASALNNVKAVPNPYVGSYRWNNPLPSDTNPWEHRLQFINLPADATIKIFTVDGDYVDEIHAGQTVRKGANFMGEGNNSVAEWDLITRNNQEAAPGLYLYVVESPSLGQTTGKFVIVR